MVGANTSERRDTEQPIPANLSDILTWEQRFMLHRMESAGWELLCVRRSFLHSPVIVLLNPKRDCYCTLEADGAANRNAPIRLRGSNF